MKKREKRVANTWINFKIKFKFKLLKQKNKKQLLMIIMCVFVCIKNFGIYFKSFFIYYYYFFIRVRKKYIFEYKGNVTVEEAQYIIITVLYVFLDKKASSMYIHTKY